MHPELAKELLLLCVSFIWEKEEMTTASHKPATSMDTLSLKSSYFPQLLQWTQHGNYQLLKDQEIPRWILLVLRAN